MKGLLQKDLYMIWRYGRTLLLISLVFLAVSVMGENRDNFFFVIYPVLFGGVLPVTLISYEERCGWNSWCDTMPVSRTTVVNARYVCTFLCFLALYLLTLAVQAVVRIPRGEGKALLELAQVLPAMGLVTPAVMLPVTLRWGVEKGRLVYYVVIGLLVALGLILFQNIRDLGGTLPPLVMGLSLPLTLLVFAASWLLSVRIYQNREF